jgi:hypothetical protein
VAAAGLAPPSRRRRGLRLAGSDGQRYTAGTTGGGWGGRLLVGEADRDGYGRMRVVEVAVRRCRREAATVEVELVVARQKRCARKAAAMVVVVVGGGEVWRGDRSTTVSKKVCGRALDRHSRETADGGTTGEGVARAVRGRRWFAWKGEAGGGGSHGVGRGETSGCTRAWVAETEADDVDSPKRTDSVDLPKAEPERQPTPCSLNRVV